MKLGISMDAYRKACEPVEAVHRLANIGFDCLEFNLSDYVSKDSPLAVEGWMDWIEGIANAVKEMNMRVSQVHAPIYRALGDHDSDEHFDLMTERMFTACEIMQIPYAVFHPRFKREGLLQKNAVETKKWNVEWLSAWAERASENNVFIAIENLFDFWDVPGYCTNARMIVDLIEGIDQDNVCVCLDTGHAWIAGNDPSDFAKELGPRLKVLHVHDNLGGGDQHVAPYVGSIDWPKFMETLKVIEYDGVFSFEIHHYIQRMPPEMIDDVVRIAYRIGRHLVDM